MWRKRNRPALRVGMQTGAAAAEDSRTLSLSRIKVLGPDSRHLMRNANQPWVLMRVGITCEGKEDTAFI